MSLQDCKYFYFCHYYYFPINQTSIGEVALYHERVPKTKEETIFHNRVSKLTLSLSSELSRWTPLSQSQYLSDAIRKDIEPHITHLSSLPFGPQLLHAIGYIYVSKAHEWMADNSISTRMFARVRNRKPEWQRVRELTVKAMDKFSDDSVHLGFMIRNRDLYKRLSDRDFEVSVQYNTLAILSKFIKMVWLGTVSDIESVLDSVCEKAINRSSKPKRTAKALEAYGKCLRQAYQRSSRRHNSIFYWDMFSCTGEDIYWLDSGYSEHPERVTAKNGQKLLPDTARYEYVEYGIGDPSNLVDFDQYRRNKYRRGRKPGTEGSSYAGSSGGGYGGGGDGGGDGGGCGGDGGGGGGGDGGGC